MRLALLHSHFFPILSTFDKVTLLSPIPPVYHSTLQSTFRIFPRTAIQKGEEVTNQVRNQNMFKQLELPVAKVLNFALFYIMS